MSEFARKVYQLIGEYRAILRKTLPQSERMQKLERLRLKSKPDSTTDFEFYQIAQNILQEEHQLRNQRNASYYSYSGVEQFCKCLKEFVQDYTVDQGRVVHSSQLSSKYFLEGLQTLSRQYEEVSDTVVSRVQYCNNVLAKFGENEQVARYLTLLRHQQNKHGETFNPLVKGFLQLLEQNGRDPLDLPVEQVA